MSDAKFTPGPWVFEPHNAFGTRFLGEEWPFGYVSTSKPRVPIFGMDPVLEYRVDELEANARLIAAAPEMLAQLEWASEVLSCMIGGSAQLDALNDVIAKARGEN